MEKIIHISVSGGTLEEIEQSMRASFDKVLDKVRNGAHFGRGKVGRTTVHFGVEEKTA